MFLAIRNIIAGSRANQVAIPPAGMIVLAIIVMVFAENAGTCAGANRSEELISSTAHFCAMGGFCGTANGLEGSFSNVSGHIEGAKGNYDEHS